MPSRGCPLPPEGRGWGPAKIPCGGGSAGGPAVAWCSGSAVIVTGATNTAATAGSVPAVPRKPLPLHQLVYFCSAEVVQIYSALDTPPGIWPWPPCVTSSTPW